MIFFPVIIFLGFTYGILNSIWDRDDNEVANDMAWKIHRGFYNGKFMYMSLRNPF